MFVLQPERKYDDPTGLYTDAELACHILRMCPLKWQDQYQLLEKYYPEDVKPLLLIVEHIEVMHPVNKPA